jgi:acetyl-CoA carboxylase carboxyltransferase component
MVDGSRFQEFKALATRSCAALREFMATWWGSSATMVCCLGEREKGSAFRRTVWHSQDTLIFLQNITGFIVGKQYEHGAIASDGAKMVHAVACADVPKFTVIVGASNGAGNYAMCGRGYGPRLLWMWPNSRISVMGGEQAADVLVQVKTEQLQAKGKTLSADETEAIRRPVLEKYEHGQSVLLHRAPLG